MMLLNLSSTLNEYIATPFKDSVQDIMTKVIDNYLGNFITVSQVVCGIGAVFYIGSILSKVLASGGEEKLDLWKLSRPVGIFLLIASCRLVCPAVDFIIEKPLTALTKQSHETQQKKIADKRKALEQKKTTVSQEKQSTESDEPSNLGTKISNAFTEVWDGVTGNLDFGTVITNKIWYLFECIADIFMSVAKLVIIMISSLYKILLTIFAPFAFALSMFPYFHDNIKHWFGRYIHASLWVPISYVLELVQNCCTESFLDKQIDFYNKVQLQGTYDVMSSGDGFQCFTGIVLSIVIGCMYLSIPTIASAIISSAGGEFMTGTAMTAVSWMGKAFGTSINIASKGSAKVAEKAIDNAKAKMGK
ncbi:MAG: hypothetical protein KBT22_12370 [Bacteroidales bacterium]|nr:hypothetical protein [Candidatus Scybalocola fimicaballi]